MPFLPGKDLGAKTMMSSLSGQGQERQGMRNAGARNGLYRKRCSPSGVRLPDILELRPSTE